MKLFIFHGPATSAMNNKIAEIKKTFDKDSTVEIEGDTISQKEIEAIFSQGSLFSQEKLFIVKELTPSLEKFSDQEITVILSFPKTLPSNSTLLKDYLNLKAQIVPFTEEKETNIFPFLDALVEKNPKAFSLLPPLFKEYGSQYLLTMMAFSLRRIVNPPKTLPPFILNKIQEQKRNFPKDTIQKLYKAILETDFKIKSGVLEEESAIGLLSQRFFK